MQKTIRKFSYLLIVPILLMAIQAVAFETEFQVSPQGEGSSRLISSGYYNSDDVIDAGIHVKLAENWHTYWKKPGDSGIPFTVEFSNQQNIANTQLLFPAPKRYLTYGLESWGYSDEVVFPIKITPQDKTKPVSADVKVKWAICEEICIFEDDEFKLEIDPGYKDKDNYSLISQYLERVPAKFNPDKSTIKPSNIQVSEKFVTVEFTSKEKLPKDIDLFITETSNNFKFPKPEMSFSDGDRKVVFVTPYEKLLSTASIKGTKLNFTLSNGSESLEFSGTIKTITGIQDTLGSKQRAEENEKRNIDITLLEAIIAALLGGLILNIMPCVLPVLSLKIMSMIKHGASDSAKIRKSFSFTILGIITSFVVLAAIALLLKGLGESVGWGMQFQQPAFLIFLGIILTLFAANQFGWFEILLPSKLSDKLNKAIDKKGESTPAGSFLTGAFATLLATPCTAPFLTTAISFALTAGNAMILLIFFFMGVGLAIPYILILISPSLVRIFPKPGAWMITVRKILGFFLIATVLWILYVMGANAGLFSATALFAVLGSIFFFLWIANKKNLDVKKTRLSIVYSIILAFVIPIYLSSLESDSVEMRDKWVKFDEQKISQLVAEGNTIFVDVTADWCITCKFNKARVTNPMHDFFVENNVILMKADYTVPSEEIHNYLSGNGVYAIPFNMVYGPNSPEGIRLPEILTKADVRKAVFDARAN
jgi:suppressor for copper-sensitivity B